MLSRIIYVVIGRAMFTYPYLFSGNQPPVSSISIIISPHSDSTFCPYLCFDKVIFYGICTVITDLVFIFVCFFHFLLTLFVFLLSFIFVVLLIFYWPSFYFFWFLSFEEFDMTLPSKFESVSVFISLISFIVYSSTHFLSLILTWIILLLLSAMAFALMLRTCLQVCRMTSMNGSNKLQS